MTMAPDLAAVIAEARQELGDLIEILDADGGRYVDEYAAWILGGASAGSPRPPATLVGKPATLIRELVLDSASTRRQVPARLR